MENEELSKLNDEIEKSLNKALSKDNIKEFVSFMAFQPDLDAINAVMIFSVFPESIFIAGAKEWAEGGRTISKENMERHIKVLLPFMQMTEKGYATDNRALRDVGIVLYGRFPEYEVKYVPLYVYDYTQTEGEYDKGIEGMPENPNFMKVLKAEENVTVIHTDEDIYLRGQDAYFEREIRDDETLYVKRGLSSEFTDFEYIKALVSHRFDVIFNYGYVTTGKREEYKKKVVDTVIYAILCRYRMKKELQDLRSLKEVDSLPVIEKLKFIEDVLALILSISGSLEDERRFSINEVMILRGLIPAVILFSGTKNKEEGRTLFLIYIKKMVIKASVDERTSMFRRMLDGLYGKIKEMPIEDYERLIDNAKELNITKYPGFTY